MRRRDFLKTASLAAVSGSALLQSSPARAETTPPPTSDEKPNILWITVEDMSPALGCYGDAYAATPNVDRLAAESVRYTNVFATAPVCSPVRSCMITGVLASSLGTPNLRSQMPIPAKMTGFPSYLRKAGYYCTNNVKTDYNTSNAGAIIKASWDACSAKAHWRGKKPNQKFFAIFNDMVTHQSRTMVWPYAQFRKQIGDKLPPNLRHDPAKAPVPPYYPDTPITRRTIARFYDCVSTMYQNVGRILKELDDDGLADDTIVFFYSDHGSGLPRHKRLLLDSGMRVPLIIRFPKKYQHLAPAKPGATLDRLVSFVDFPPSVLGLAALPVPDYMQGKAFVGPNAAKPRTHVYGARDRVDEAFDLARSVRDKNWLYIRNFMPHVSYNQPSWYSDQGEIRNEITRLQAEGRLKTAPQKHYAGPTRPREELYDIANDPHQINNLAGSPKHRQRVTAMRKLLRNWMLETRDLGLLPELDMARRAGKSTPYDMARSDKAYPLETILDAAELAGGWPRWGDQNILLLAHADPAVRYWAAVSLRAGGATDRLTRGALAKAMEDESPAVRIEVAWGLVDAGESTGKALALLQRELLGKDGRAALRAARALQMLGAKARPALSAMTKALAAARKGRGDSAMFIRFSLDPAVKALSAP